jgi:hypothetical protein
MVRHEESSSRQKTIFMTRGARHLLFVSFAVESRIVPRQPARNFDLHMDSRWQRAIHWFRSTSDRAVNQS